MSDPGGFSTKLDMSVGSGFNEAISVLEKLYKKLDDIRILAGNRGGRCNRSGACRMTG